MSTQRTVSLRAVLLLLTTAIAATAVVLSTVVIVIAARATIYETRQNSVIDEFRESTDALVAEISAEASDDAWLYYSGIFPGRTAIIDLAAGRYVGEMDRSEIPSSLHAFDEEIGAGEVRFRRAHLDGEEVFFVAAGWSDLERFPDTTLTVVNAYTLEPQRAQVVRMTAIAAIVGAVVLLVSGTAGLLVGRALTKPVRRLAAMARRVGQGELPDAPPRSFSDIDEVGATLRASAQSLSETVAELEQREQGSRRLVSDVAHELRTPLTSMTAVAEILDDLDSATDEQRRAAISVTSRGTRRLAALVEDLLELSRLDARGATIRFADAPLGALLHDAIALVDVADDDIVVEAAEVHVRTDPHRVRTILTNLISNALRHGEPPVRIVVEADDDAVRVRVSDDGPGIPAQDRDRVFERFVALDPSRRRTEGSGLGLAIARDNARALGGDLILVPSDTGAVFELTLPRSGLRTG
ncbi:MAG TPA: HAMP domain-containing histidine kinase [Candidatus Microbacterium stercoravium]|uniref:histidine kinase n=1 Tax=Candidatus Microbacterium stercoravium TaxID=2838697 RepID=A0A9D2KIQ3_9MICO|nr:HAMP domain-containing histidine kinase [Candidatus Microbacterium stercoravium]